MSALADTLAGRSETSCCQCGIVYAVPSAWLQAKRRNGDDFYCPNGHTLTYGKTYIDGLKKQIADGQEKIREEQRRRFEAEATAGQERAKRERLQRRVRAGVCPLCKRRFIQLARHMTCKHPEKSAAV